MAVGVENGLRPIDAIGKAHLAMRGTGIKPVDFLAGTKDVEVPKHMI